MWQACHRAKIELPYKEWKAVLRDTGFNSIDTFDMKDSHIRTSKMASRKVAMMTTVVSVETRKRRNIQSKKAEAEKKRKERMAWLDDHGIVICYYDNCVHNSKPSDI